MIGHFFSAIDWSKFQRWLEADLIAKSEMSGCSLLSRSNGNGPKVD